MNTLDLAKEGPVIPVIVINRVEDAVPMVGALNTEPTVTVDVVKLIEADATDVPLLFTD